MTDTTELTRCLFPVAGYGTRFLPVTKSMPKEMLPILNKPLVQYAVEEAFEAGMKQISFVTGRGKRAIADYFDISYELEQEIRGSKKEYLLEDVRKLMQEGSFTFTRQGVMRGLGHAVLTGRILIGHNPFGVALADDLCLSDSIGMLAQLRAVYESHRCTVIAVDEVPDEQVSRFGIISGTDIGDNVVRVSEIVEKPSLADAPSNLAVIGRYILTPDIFDILAETEPDSSGEVQLTNALAVQVQQGCLLALKCHGQRFDCGSLEGYVEATNYRYKQLKEKNGS